jgi:hypothetical protein
MLQAVRTIAELLVGIGSAGGLIMSIINYFEVKAHGVVIEKLERNTNGMAATLANKNVELQRISGAAEHAKGVLEGAAEERKNPT